MVNVEDFSEVAVEEATDIALETYEAVLGDTNDVVEATKTAEGCVIMMSDLLGRIERKLKHPRGFICSKELMPKRATSTSAGYDFVAPEDITIPTFGSARVNTHVKAHMLPDEVLKIYPRSSLAIKRGITLANGVAIIDSDFENEIVLSIVNTGAKSVMIKKGERIAQGIFQKFLTCGDEPSNIRAGGIGSTGK
mgnify:CR=1 FL=1